MRVVAKKGAVSVDAALAAALGEQNPAKLKSILSSLTDLSERLRPREPGPFSQQLKTARDA
jgi:hypothetical protein